MFRTTILILEYGWVELEIEFNHLFKKIRFAYTPIDGMEELVKAALDVMDNRDAKVYLYDNPDQYRLEIHLLDEEYCVLNLHDFEIEIMKTQFAKAILRMFDQYLYEHSKADYENSWRHSFPERYLVHLKQKTYSTKQS